MLVTGADSKTLSLRRYVALPKHGSGGFDHGDVDISSGKVFVAHTANNAVEVIDGERLAHLATIPGCEEASGVMCAQDHGLCNRSSQRYG